MSCFLATPSNQDTLHTPQILPQFESRPVKSEPPTQDEPENLTIPTTVDDSINIPKTSRNIEVNDLKFSQKSSQPPIPLLPKPSVIYASPIITSPTAISGFSLDASRSSESVKDKLKSIILSNSGSQIDKKRIKTEPVPTILIGAVPLIATPANLILDSNKFDFMSNETAQPEAVPVKASDNGSGSRKRARGERPEASVMKVERNRAAARRYR